MRIQADHELDSRSDAFGTRIEQLERAIDDTEGIFPRLGVMAIAATIHQLRDLAERFPTIAADCLERAEELSKLPMPRNGNQLQDLVSMLTAIELPGGSAVERHSPFAAFSAAAEMA